MTDFKFPEESVGGLQQFWRSWPWFGTLAVRGVEVTQGIQYYRSGEHLADPVDVQPDNSVKLVARKPAWVRVYVRNISPKVLGEVVPSVLASAGDLGFPWKPSSGVTGKLKVARRRFGLFYYPVAELDPEPPGTVTAHGGLDYAEERGTLANSLNFVIPANVMCGRLRLTVELMTPDGHTATKAIYVDATLRQTLRVAGIMVGYNGPSSSAPGAPNLNLSAPTLGNLQATAGWTLLTFPVQSTAAFRAAGTITWNLPLTDSPSCGGCCSPNWVALNTAVQAQVVADGNQPNWLYYGLMANGIPMGPIIGCNTGTVSTGSNGDGVTMAHELGHRCGLSHAPCGTGGDPNYPAYEPHDPSGTPMASIGEYGLDINNGNVFSPETFKDLMSYCSPRWISLYHYGRLLNNPALAPTQVCQDHWWWEELLAHEYFERFPGPLPDPVPDPPGPERLVNPEPVISIIGMLYPDDRVEVTSVMRLHAVPQVHDGTKTSYRAELLGDDEAPLASGTLYRLQGKANCDCDGGDVDGPYLVQAFIPDVERGTALRISIADREMWTRRARSTRRRSAPQLTADLDKDDQLRVSWSTPSEEGIDTEGWLQWSADQGETWQALTVGLHGSDAQVDTTSLPSGRLRIRLLLSDGFETARSRPVSITIPRRPPDIAILAPREGQTFLAGSTLRLWGAAIVNGDTLENDDVATWSLDDEQLGSGLDVILTAPAAGEHTAELRVRIGRQPAATATVTFRTIEPPKPPAIERPATEQYLGNQKTMEVHDLHSESAQCQIDEIIEAGNAVLVIPETLAEAHRQGFDNCAHCIGGSLR